MCKPIFQKNSEILFLGKMANFKFGLQFKKQHKCHINQLVFNSAIQGQGVLDSNQRANSC